MSTVTILNGVEIARDKRDLNLTAHCYIKALEDEGFNEEFYKLEQLNNLAISANLKELPSKFGLFTNLTSLMLHKNQFKNLPMEIGNLSKLKILDVSSNLLEAVPDTLCKLSMLSILNLSNNNLTFLPSLKQNTKLASVNLSVNKFEVFPDCCYEELTMFSELFLNFNNIASVPESIGKLQHIKVLDISNNKITEIPSELSLLGKLKDLNLKGNNLKDNRLMKMVDQCHAKKVIDFIKNNYKKLLEPHAKSTLQSQSVKEANQNEIDEPSTNLLKYIIQIYKPDDRGVEIHSITSNVKTVRQSVLCCVVRNIQFTEDKLKQFIQLQNKFHDTVCNKRERASIGTHDLDLVTTPLRYTALPPQEISLLPLGETVVFTAADYILNKKLEAEKLKKEKKKNWQTGIVKYMNLLDGLTKYPCLVDDKNQVISFPPITNCEVSKISLATKNMLIEVTSTYEKKVTRDIMDKLVKEFLKLEAGEKNEDDVNILHLEQCVVLPEKGPNLHYPTNNDLICAASSNTKKVNM